MRMHNINMWCGVVDGVRAEGVVLHDGVEGVVVRGGGRGRGRWGRGGRAHGVGAQLCQAQRLRRAGLRVQRAPQVQHLPQPRASTQLSTTLRQHGHLKRQPTDINTTRSERDHADHTDLKPLLNSTLGRRRPSRFKNASKTLIVSRIIYISNHLIYHW